MKFVGRNQIVEWLADNLPSKRLKHILRVEQMSIHLAMIHHLDPDLAGQAGLLHDVAKCYSPQRLLSIANAHNWVLHPIEQAHPHLLHAPVGAVEVKRLFSIEDEMILDAIRNHTLGREQMSPLSCAVFLADSLEPGRGDSDALTQLRTVSQINLYRAVRQTCDYTIKQLIKRGHPIHPRMINTRNWALTRES